MIKPISFDPTLVAVALSHELRASTIAETPDPPVPVDGATFGVASMSENSPHDGEMHPDGDEVLYLISGRIRIVFPDDPLEDILVLPGRGLIVPRGMWHRVDILEPSQIAYLTPGPHNQFRPLPDTT
jgi:mannose-6-phosphate isomerase-like protein (cupin superfamily)